ncbi:MAG: ABC transporter ATP-binding protein [Thermostichales cyanobacterium SRBZ-1_bins_19]
MVTAPESATATPLLEFRQVSLTYKMQGQTTTIIENVSIQVASREFIALVGPSGCGKTSLLRMVGGLAPVLQGELLFQGQAMTGSRGKVGIAFQNPVMLPWRTTLQNVLLPLEVVSPHKQQFQQNLAAYQAAAAELLKTVGLGDFQHYYPWQLSGGMRQRASLCRALIHQPQLLLLDEPFGALDAFTREEMWVLVQKLWQQTGCTGLLVTHDLVEAVFLADTVYVMSPPPSRILLQLQEDLPRPRTLEMCLTPEFQAYVRQVRQQIQQGGGLH